ncbi:unnamed protein product [Notodromas monacha]|uniref:Uncharacterized protein n=1 Tax=Notodromas monacha TaxID=399045 RepID=A0A7R9GAN6_9CRUS|nr:unnamed protein product [Notodromas monacha]CAG0915460.1 unnamed protein product [Notodromas monacha]
MFVSIFVMSMAILTLHGYLPMDITPVLAGRHLKSEPGKLPNWDQLKFFWNVGKVFVTADYQSCIGEVLCEYDEAAFSKSRVWSDANFAKNSTRFKQWNSVMRFKQPAAILAAVLLLGGCPDVASWRWFEYIEMDAMNETVEATPVQIMFLALFTFYMIILAYHNYLPLEITPVLNGGRNFDGVTSGFFHGTGGKLPDVQFIRNTWNFGKITFALLLPIPTYTTVASSMTISIPFVLDLPTSTTLGINSINGRSFTGASTRREFYDIMEKMLQRMFCNFSSTTAKRFGLDGKACILRAICEIGDAPLLHDGLLGEVLSMVLRASYNMDTSDTHTIKKLRYKQFLDAEKFGRETGGKCHLAYPTCPVSLTNLFP